MQYNSRQPLFVHPLVGYWVFSYRHITSFLAVGFWNIQAACIQFNIQHLHFQKIIQCAQYDVTNTNGKVHSRVRSSHTYIIYFALPPTNDMQWFQCWHYHTELLKFPILIFDMRSIFSTFYYRLIHKF